MKRFYNMKISTKLVISFIFVAIIAGIVGMVGIFSISSLDKSDKILYEHMTKPISQMSDISTAFQRTRVNLRDSILATSTADIQANLSKIEERNVEIDNLSEEFEKTIISEEMREAYDRFLAARNEYNTYLNDFNNLVKANKDEEAFKMLAETSDFGIASRVEQDVIDEIIEMKVSDAEDTSNSNTNQASNAIMIMIIVIIFAIMIALALGLFLSRIISKPIKLLADAADKLALGDVDVNVKSTSKDEIGKLMYSFQKMVDNIKVQAIAADKIGDGDFSEDIIPKSEKDVLTTSMKNINENLRSLVKEAGMLTKAAVEGKLDTRGDAEKFKSHK